MSAVWAALGVLVFERLTCLSLRLKVEDLFKSRLK